jgi:hypothetical protein
LIAALVLLVSASAASGQPPAVAEDHLGKELRLAQVASGPKPGPRENRVRAVVEEYWRTTSTRRYELLSRDYQSRLRRMGDVTGPPYAVVLGNPERVWSPRRYQEVRFLGSAGARATILVDWEQEGYRGIMTFVFDLVMEDGAWKIENVVY